MLREGGGPARNQPAGPTRQCSRTACSDSATATLTYDYGGSQVWLDPLSEDRHPHGYDLCRRHADALAVPIGWQLADRRRPIQLSHDLLAG